MSAHRPYAERFPRAAGNEYSRRRALDGRSFIGDYEDRYSFVPEHITAWPELEGSTESPDKFALLAALEVVKETYLQAHYSSPNDRVSPDTCGDACAALVELLVYSFGQDRSIAEDRANALVEALDKEFQKLFPVVDESGWTR